MRANKIEKKKKLEKSKSNTLCGIIYQLSIKGVKRGQFQIKMVTLMLLQITTSVTASEPAASLMWCGVWSSSNFTSVAYKCSQVPILSKVIRKHFIPMNYLVLLFDVIHQPRRLGTARPRGLSSWLIVLQI